MSLSKRYDDGPPLEEWPSSGPPVENDSTPLQTFEECSVTSNFQDNNCPHKRPRSVTPESARNINREISNDRSLTCDSVSQNTRLSTTSVQGLTGSAGVLRPFWNEYTWEQSMKWWLPEKTDCVVLESNSWSGSLKRTGHNSWFSVQTSVPTIARPESLQKTCSPSSQCLWRDIMGYVPPPIAEKDKRPSKKAKIKSDKPPAEKSRRIRLFPTQDQRQKLRRWMGTARWTYNRCLAAVEKEGVRRSKKDLRARCLNAGNFEHDPKLKWVLETPYDVRDEAMNDLLKGYASNFAKGSPFKMKFRSLKDRQQSIVIHSKHWRKTRGEFSFFANMKAAEPLPSELDYDSRIVMNRLGEFFICIPKPLDVRAENQGPLSEVSNEGEIFYLLYLLKMFIY
jgi:Helix-turn-helix domain